MTVPSPIPALRLVVAVMATSLRVLAAVVATTLLAAAWLASAVGKAVAAPLVIAALGCLWLAVPARARAVVDLAGAEGDRGRGRRPASHVAFKPIVGGGA